MNEPTAPPDWALLYVRGAVRMGMSVQEITQHLISRGMSAEDAILLVTDTIEKNHAENAEPIGSSEWGRPLRMTLSVVIAAAGLLVGYLLGGSDTALTGLIWVVPGLGLTWTPELTDIMGSSWGTRLCAFGWILLLFYLCSRTVYLILWSIG
jgi:hypothetical protein